MSALLQVSRCLPPGNAPSSLQRECPFFGSLFNLTPRIDMGPLSSKLIEAFPYTRGVSAKSFFSRHPVSHRDPFLPLP